MASAGLSQRDAVLFVGGSDNPYNYNGVGYDGRPSRPLSGALLFDLTALSWQRITQRTPASMDHRGLAPLGDGWATIGGMLDGQAVSDQVIVYTID